jgi:DNA-binding response OmpR family regulator
MMRGHRILVVDDDPDILRIVTDNLVLDGYCVQTATTGRQALSHLDAEVVSLVVLDLALPDMDGIQVCRAIRARSEVPIIMLTARDRVPDKVLGLESGADDYIVKPFDYLELAARIRACLRRRNQAPAVLGVLELAGIRIDTNMKQVWRGRERISLTNREFDLLLLLVKNVGRAMSRLEIRNMLWPEGELYRDSRTIDVHVQHLRSKLEDDPTEPQLIRTVPGVGYAFAVKGTEDQVNL